MAARERAVRELYQAPLGRFVAERARLVAQLREAGEKAAATALARRRRPTIAAWTVNQLYWHARDRFDDLLAVAARLRRGDLGAATAHRDAMAALRKRAATILEQAGHGASEATLRRVTATLAAVAARGGFEPDPPGALAADRDPPGFEAFVAAADTGDGRHARAAAAARSATDRGAPAATRRAAEERAELRRRKAEARRRRAERTRLESRLRAARAELGTREREFASLERKLRAAEDATSQARSRVRDLERLLAELGDVAAP